ncbi:MAG: DUF1573 domain-containing protein [Verrucomicrobiota bacterium]
MQNFKFLISHHVTTTQRNLVLTAKFSKVLNSKSQNRENFDLDRNQNHETNDSRKRVYEDRCSLDFGFVRVTRRIFPVLNAFSFVTLCLRVRQVFNAFKFPSFSLGVLCFILAVNPAFSVLVFEKSTVEIPPDPTLKEWVADYPFKNTGNQSVTIKDIRTCCECTSAKLEKKMYAPGESGKVTLVFKTAGKTGIQEKHAVITTDGKSEPDVIFLKGKISNIYDYIFVTPQSLRWERNEKRSSKIIQIEIFDKDCISQANLMKISSDLFKFQIKKEEKTNIQIEIIPPQDLKPHKGIIKMPFSLKQAFIGDLIIKLQTF